MVLYAVSAADEEAIKKAVFSFATPQEFQLALQRTIDGSIRQFVATTKQSDILGMRAEIVDHTKKNLDEVVLTWGYVVRDIQITDMTFDKEIIDSMARVVSSKNLLAAASNEGAALLVKRTKDAEAEAAYKTIGAEAEKKASALRGEGLALFRKNIADGMKDAADSLKDAGVDSELPAVPRVHRRAEVRRRSLRRARSSSWTTAPARRSGSCRASSRWPRISPLGHRSRRKYRSPRQRRREFDHWSRRARFFSLGPGWRNR